MRRAGAALALAPALALWLAAPCAGAWGHGAALDLSSFAFQPHPGATLPLAVPLVDEAGSAVTLGRYFTGKPAIVVLEYLRCKSLCGVTLENVVAALDGLPLNAGRDFQMLAISIDPRDSRGDIARAKAKYLALYRDPGGALGIHFLTGPAASVRHIADAIGFPYRYDADTGQYIHPAGFIVAGPDGRIDRYIFGVGAAGAELRAALAGAAQGEALTPLDRLFLLCHIEGAPLGRYTVPVIAAFTIADLAAGAAAFVVFLTAFRRRGRG